MVGVVDAVLRDCWKRWVQNVEVGYIVAFVCYLNLHSVFERFALRILSGTLYLDGKEAKNIY